MTTFKPEVRVNTTTVGDQGEPSVVGLAGGGYVVAWTSYGEAGADIFAQRFSGAGERLGGETRVNSTTAHDQFVPTVTALSDGGYVVSWMSALDDEFRDFDVYAQRYDAAGAAVGGETLVNTTTASRQLSPSVTGLEDGGYLVTWSSVLQDGAGSGVFSQRFTSAGAPAGGETLVSKPTAERAARPDAAALADGGYVVAWESLGQDGSGAGIYAQRYDDAGEKVGAEARVNSRTAGDQESPRTAGLAGGGYVVTWTSEGQDGSGTGVYAQRFSSSGGKVGGETRVNTTTANDQRVADVAALPDGGYIVIWTSFDQDGSNFGVYAQRFDGGGARIGGETLVNETTANGQTEGAVAALADGRIVAAWSSLNQDGSGQGVYLRETGPAVAPSTPDLVASSDGGASSTDDVTNDSTPTFAGTAAPGSQVRLLDGERVIGRGEADDNGAWTITAGSLARGAHAITAVATSPDGVEAISPGALGLTIDKTAPLAPSRPDLIADSDTGASDTDNITADSTPTFVGTAEAGATVTLRDGSTVIGAALADAQGQWSITSVPLSDGRHAISAFATDAAGNDGSASGALAVFVEGWLLS